MIFVLFLTVIAIFAFVALLVLSVLGIVFSVLRFAGKATFKIAKFGIKAGILSTVLAIALLILIIL